MSHFQTIGIDVGNVLKKTAYGLWGGVSLVAGVLLLRSFAGALTQNMSPLAACLGSTLATAASLTAFFCSRFASKQYGLASPSFWQLTLCTILPPILVGVVLVPAQSSLGIAWVTILGIGTAVTLHLFKDKVTKIAGASTPVDEGIPDSPVIQATPDLSQWMTRRLITEAGEIWDQVEGQITVEFAADQQHATVHLSMCPPLPSTPEIECEVPEDLDLNWKVASVHPYGVRLEVRRPRSATEPARIPLSYTMAALQGSEMMPKAA